MPCGSCEFYLGFQELAGLLSQPMFYIVLIVAFAIVSPLVAYSVRLYVRRRGSRAAKVALLVSIAVLAAVPAALYATAILPLQQGPYGFSIVDGELRVRAYVTGPVEVKVPLDDCSVRRVEVERLARLAGIAIDGFVTGSVLVDGVEALAVVYVRGLDKPTAYIFKCGNLTIAIAAPNIDKCLASQGQLHGARQEAGTR